MEKFDSLKDFDLDSKDGLKKAVSSLFSHVSYLEEKINSLESYVYELEDSLDFGSCSCDGCHCSEDCECDCCGHDGCCDDE